MFETDWPTKNRRKFEYANAPVADVCAVSGGLDCALPSPTGEGAAVS
jgi:hypothetical protein